MKGTDYFAEELDKVLEVKDGYAKVSMKVEKQYKTHSMHRTNRCKRVLCVR